MHAPCLVRLLTVLALATVAATGLPATAGAATSDLPMFPGIEIPPDLRILMQSPWDQAQAGVSREFVAIVGPAVTTTQSTVTWDFGDGSGPIAGESHPGMPSNGTAHHAFPAEGTYVVTATLAAADGGAVLARATASFDVLGGAPAATMAPVTGLTALGLVQGRPFPVACGGVKETGSSVFVPIHSCTVTARVSSDLQRRLGLASDLLVMAGRPFAAGTLAPEPVVLVIPPAISTALAALRRDVTLQVDAQVFDFVGRASAPATQQVVVSGMAGPHDCPQPVATGVTCAAGKGRRGATGPAITGLRWQVASDAAAGQSLPGTYLNDALLGRHGSDVLTGDAGDDVLWGDAVKTASPAGQRDRLAGGAGNDWLYASRGTNTISAGDGNDQVLAVDGKGTIDCGPGKDTVTLKKQKPLKQTKAQKKAHKKPKLAPDAYRLKSCEKVTRR